MLEYSLYIVTISMHETMRTWISEDSLNMASISIFDKTIFR